MTAYGSVLDLIGNTPLVDVSALSPNPNVRILIKLEGQNPGGSVKDRIALAMIEAAEADGTLQPGATLIEPSSGNTGIGMALVCRIKGYKLKVVLATNVSIERRQLLESWGVDIIESPGAEGSNGAVRRAMLWPLSTPSGLSSTSTPTRPTQWLTMRAQVRRSGLTARRSPTSSPAWVPRAPCSGWGAT